MQSYSGNLDLAIGEKINLNQKQIEQIELTIPRAISFSDPLEFSNKRLSIYEKRLVKKIINYRLDSLTNKEIQWILNHDNFLTYLVEGYKEYILTNGLDYLTEFEKSILVILHDDNAIPLIELNDKYTFGHLETKLQTCEDFIKYKQFLLAQEGKLNNSLSKLDKIEAFDRWSKKILEERRLWSSLESELKTYQNHLNNPEKYEQYLNDEANKSFPTKTLGDLDD